MNFKDRSPDWDERYRRGFYKNAKDPHKLLVDHIHLLKGRSVLDIAMGMGRDALFCASSGARVTGLEKSWEALMNARQAAAERRARIHFVQADAGRLPFKQGSFQGVTIFFFLLRDIAPDIAAILDTNGILIYETFLKRQNEVDRPRNPAYLLEDGELLDLFPGFEPIYYDEGMHSSGGKTRITAQLVARKL